MVMGGSGPVCSHPQKPTLPGAPRALGRAGAGAPAHDGRRAVQLFVVRAAGQVGAELCIARSRQRVKSPAAITRAAPITTGIVTVSPKIVTPISEAQTSCR